MYWQRYRSVFLVDGVRFWGYGLKRPSSGQLDASVFMSVPRIPVKKRSIMKKLAVVATWGSILLVALGFLTLGEERKSPAASGQAPTEYLLDEINSLSRALFQLAAERYSVHSDKNE